MNFEFRTCPQSGPCRYKDVWNNKRDRHLLVFGSAEGWFRGRLWHRFYDRLAGVSRVTVEGTVYNKHFTMVDNTDQVFDAPFPAYTRRTARDIVVPGGGAS